MNAPALIHGQSRARDIIGEARRVGPDRIEGFVYDAADLDEHFVVELLLDRAACAVARANLFDIALLRMGVADGRYRFVFAIDPERADGRAIEVRLANLDVSLGAPGHWSGYDPLPTPSAIGEIEWRGGLNIVGWLDEEAGEIASAYVDGECIARARVDHWTHIGQGRDGAARRAFTLTLPRRFADGRLRQAQVTDERGRALIGSPCPFFAFEDGLAAWLESRAELRSHQIRGRLFDEVFPASAPFEGISEWRAAFPLEADPDIAGIRIAVALVGDGDAETTFASLQTQGGVDCAAAALRPLAGRTRFDPADLETFLDEEPCALVVFALAGTRFEPNAIARLTSCWRDYPKARLAYGDVTITAQDGGEWPLAFPAFDYERMLEQGYGAYLFATPTQVVREALAAGADNLFRLFNAPWDRRGEGPEDLVFAGAIHAPGFLGALPPLDITDDADRLAEATAAHLAARGVVAEVDAGEGALLPAARVRRVVKPARVSILIPSRDRLDLVRPCMDSLARTIDFDQHEIILIDNGSTDPDCLDYLGTLSAMGISVLHAPGPFNFAKLIGAGAGIATGDFLLLLNNDIEAIEAGWLEEMLARAGEPDVGAVGATLLWPSGVVQHGGIALGIGFAPSHVFNDRIDGDPGYGDLLKVAHETGAVTGACLLTPRRLFHELGGFDVVRFPINYNDVDYCLRLRAAGHRIVMTPHAKLTHRESSSRGRDHAREDSDRFAAELRRLRAIWGKALLDDPCYSPLLARNGVAYGALAWPPRPAEPRASRCPPPRETPPGF